jgi:acetyltransferase EpsM
MRVVIYGARADGQAKVVLELLAGGFEVAGLLDDDDPTRRIGSLEVVDLASVDVDGVLLGFGAARGRLAIVERLEQDGLALPVLIHPRAFVAPSAVLGPGCQVLPGAHIGPGAVLGRGVLVNSGAIVEHDNRIGDCAVIDPGATLAGRVFVGAEAEIGSGAVVIPDVRVGERAVVGAGAVVIADVPPDVTVVGVPARQR